MVNHRDIWRAIDALAARHGFSPSGLAIRAGLDATSFNKSKRFGPQGRERWPSTESIAKILKATGSTFSEFVRLVEGESKRANSTKVPVLGMAQAGQQGFFDDAGYPAGTGWDEVEFPGVTPQEAYALKIVGDSMMPVYRDGDVIVCVPGAGVRKGDRAVIKLDSGEVMAKEVSKRTRDKLHLTSLNPRHPDLIVPLKQVVWLVRIAWASQ